MSSPSKSRISPLVFIVLAIVVIGTAWWGINAFSSAKPTGASPDQATSGPPPATVIMAPVQSIPSVQIQRVVGTLRAKSRSEIAARESGAILEISADEGDTVAKDSVIARLDPRRLTAQIAEARAQITVAEATVHQKKSRVERTSIDLEMKEKLLIDEAISLSEVLDARSASNVDKSISAATLDSLKAAESRLELLTIRLEDLTIKAPFAGTVVARHSELGEWVEPGTPIVTLVSTGPIEAWLNVPERFATVARGKEISVTLTATGQTVTSTALTIIPEAEASTRTLHMVATLPNPDNTLVPGLSVTAGLPVTEKANRLAVPVNAVVQGYAGPGVFVPSRQGKGLPVAKRIPVTILFQDDALIYLEADDLNAGDQVVVEGNERLFPFQPLIIAEREKGTQ
jgi:RND family efflux transporter MFP subunit